MLIQQTIQKMQALKLHGAAKALMDQTGNAAAMSLGFEERLGLLIDHEVTYRENRRLRRLLKKANLRYPSACLEDVDYHSHRGLDKSLVASLALCDWIRQGTNLLIIGPTGTGKSWLGCAFGNQACRQGLTAEYHRLSMLLEELAIAHGLNTFAARLKSLARVDLLILDDFGLGGITATNRSDFFELIEARSDRRSTVITSQLPQDRWHDFLADNPTMADATLDRLTSGALQITIGGESMRKARARRGRTEGGAAPTPKR
jgi:DNA replication protein DnaC